MGLFSGKAERGFLEEVYGYREECIRSLIAKVNCAREEAEDIFTEAVMSLVEKFRNGKVNEIKNKKAYLIGICTIMWKNIYLKKKKKDKAIPDIERYFYDFLTESGIEGESSWQLKEKLLNISQLALQEMGEKCQQIIKSFYLEKKPMSEIAAIMGFNNTEVAIASKYRCFKKLRDRAIEMREVFEKKGF